MSNPEQSWIVDDHNPIIRKKCNNLTFPIDANDQSLIDRMVAYIDVCYHNEAKKYNIRSGIALAANQVGLTKRVIYIHFNGRDNEEYKYLIANPKVIAESAVYAYISNGEGCLSVEKDVDGIVKRRNKVIVEAIDLFTNKPIVIHAEGLLAICLQHEMDHLDGILYYDHIDKANPMLVDNDWIKY